MRKKKENILLYKNRRIHWFGEGKYIYGALHFRGGKRVEGYIRIDDIPSIKWAEDWEKAGKDMGIVNVKESEIVTMTRVVVR